MSEVMTPMSFEQLVDWVLQEKKKRGTVFGQHHAYRADGTHNRTMFGRTLETPIGPAAGPHTQMTTEDMPNQIAVVGMVEDVKTKGGSSYVTQKVRNIAASYLQ